MVPKIMKKTSWGDQKTKRTSQTASNDVQAGRPLLCTPFSSGKGPKGHGFRYVGCSGKPSQK
jgi:hypothetical protein